MYNFASELPSGQSKKKELLSVIRLSFPKASSCLATRKDVAGWNLEFKPPSNTQTSIALHDQSKKSLLCDLVSVIVGEERSCASAKEEPGRPSGCT